MKRRRKNQNIKKAYSDTAISEQAMREQKRRTKRLISRLKSTTIGTKCTHSNTNYFSEFIPIGEVNAIKATQLAAILHCDKRGLRKRIHRARKEGYPICGTSNGLFFPANEEEYLHCIRRLKAQRNALSQDIRHISQAFENYKGVRRR